MIVLNCKAKAAYEPSIRRTSDHFPGIGKIVGETINNQFTARVKRPAPQWQDTAETREAPATGQATEQVWRLLRALGSEAMGTKELMAYLQLKHRSSFLENYLNPALAQQLAEMTQPDSPRSPTQKYHLTASGRRYLQQVKNETLP